MILTTEKPLAQQQLAAHEERLEDRLAQIGQLVHRPAELGGVHLEHVPILRHAGAHHRGTAGEHVHVARELAGAVHRDHARRVVRLLQDLDAAVDHDEEAEVAVTGLEQVFAGADGTRVPTRAEGGEVLRAEGGKSDILVDGHLAK